MPKKSDNSSNGKLSKAASKAKDRSILKEGEDIAIASHMIALGARLQVLQKTTDLSYDRLSKLYREIRGSSAPKGMLPFSSTWFMSWRPNVHASLFYSIYQYLETHTPSKGATALVQAYSLYLEHEQVRSDGEPVLTFTRAWMLLRYMGFGELRVRNCDICSHDYIDHKTNESPDFVCSSCNPPARIIGMLAKENRKTFDLKKMLSTNGNEQSSTASDNLQENRFGAYMGKSMAKREAAAKLSSQTNDTVAQIA